MKRLSSIIVLVALSFAFNAQADYTGDTYFCSNKTLGKLPVQQGGRVKPLKVHAKETIKHLTGKSSVDGLNSLTAYCLISLQGLGLKNTLDPKAPIEHVETRKLLGLSEDHKRESLSKLVSEFPRIRATWQKIKEESSYKKDLNKLLSRINLYAELRDGQNWLMPEITPEKDVNWIPLSSFLKEDKVIAAKSVSSTPFVHVLIEAKKEYIKAKDDNFLIEFTFSNLHLSYVSLLLSLLGLAALTLFKNFNVALGLSVITVLAQTALITFRVMISGRAPITNMYETVLFSGYGALVLSLIIGHYRKEKTFVYMGLAYNVCTLFMLNFADGMLSESISPLVPVLRDNFWLSTHVTTIILSYGALALSWILGNTVLIKKRFMGLSKEESKYYSDLIYTTLKYGTVLLAAGIILGGVWADYSWGRFWGWDPKETWSLIVLCLYMAILHGKYTNWIPERRFIPLTTASFMSVMMAWFGVNYILASGLHSYGFSEGGAIFLGTFFAIQTAVLIVTGIDFNSEKTA
ncbi:cytochrome c biogenesis protein CcsA [Halobacteriovorax sp. GB3]|uniref:cytochrome c biogenesis protein n=1 Tax=Halobacteriovorax sp. GB3 TaxID=2719615 RepID=UPI002362E102|nr:cytochrome c biogenesis protein CcsA [Halobacteriovorax sp. GB3]MDD0852357.1 cytochrome c biogenesis protein CcsA [Halobacteriovorax sp. GB3]